MDKRPEDHDPHSTGSNDESSTRRPDDVGDPPATPESEPAPEGHDDRRRFLKGLIAGAAAASLAGAGVSHATPGRKLPFHSAAGSPSTLSFARDLAEISGQVPPAQWQQVEAKMEEYLGPLVDTGDFLASAYNITIEGCITISGDA